jgi:hypothetical protein
MTAVLSRIRRLIALAANESAAVPEARTAAHIAARLIQGHRIELHDPTDLGTRGVVTPRSAASTVPSKIIKSRYDGLCNRCGHHYGVGESVAWTKGRGAAHVKCADV